MLDSEIRIVAEKWLTNGETINGFTVEEYTKLVHAGYGKRIGTLTIKNNVLNLSYLVIYEEITTHLGADDIYYVSSIVPVD